MSLCEKCRSCGLPIYPVRYAVSPEQMGANLPQWAEKEELLSLNKDSKYVLRTTRKGYLYLFCQYEDNGLDLDVSVYKVDEKGGFWQQDISKELDLLRFGDHVKNANNEQQTIPLNEIETSCSNGAHQSSNIAFIVLAKPDKCDKAWLAYSEHKWSLNTLRKYLYEEDKRDIRMQVIKPKEWIQKQESANGITCATKEAIASTMEGQYNDYLLEQNITGIFHGKYPVIFPYLYSQPVKDSPISTSPIGTIDENRVFEYNKSLFKIRTTLTPWLNLSNYPKESYQFRENYSSYIFRKMESSQRNSTKCPAMMVALMDSIGIAAELSNWGNSALAAFKKVITERQWENSTCSSIELFEQFIKNNDLANNQQNFKKHIQQKNRDYLSDVEYYRQPINSPSVLGLPSSTRRIPGWSSTDKVKGERVIRIVNQAKNFTAYDPDSPYQNPYLSDLEKHVNLCKWNAKALVNFTEKNYLLKELGEDKYASIIEDIFKLNNTSHRNEIEKLRTQCSLIRNELEVKAKGYEASWHAKNKTEESGEKRWRKYKNRLLQNKSSSIAYDNYRKKYNQFLQESGSYVERLIEDLIKWIDCFKQKENHPISLAADDFAQDSDDYLAFANDILMTLGSHINNDRVVDLFTQFITDETLDAHNIVWSAVFAKRKLTKEQQQKYINLMHSLDKTTPMQREDYGQLLDKLATVLSFSQEESEEAKIFEACANAMTNFDVSILDEENKSYPLDFSKELVSLFESQRNFLLDDNSIDAQITVANIKPIKENILATSVILLKYLQLKGGKISSAFAEAFFVAINPSPQLSKSALERKMEAYYDWSKRIKKLVANNFNTASTKLSIAYQNINQKINSILSTTTAGKGLIGFMAFYQLKTLYEIISDDRYKTQAQQSEANYKLVMAATGIISLSFKFVIVHGENNRLNEKILKNFGFFGNVFGFISSITQIAISWNEDTTNKTKVEKAFHWLGLITAIVSAVDLFLQLGKKSLLQVTNLSLQLIISTVFKNFVLGELVIHAGRGVMLLFILALNPWISLGLFICQLIYEFNKPDEIEEWLERCRFGEFQGGLHEKRSSRYVSQQQEVEALKAILMKYEKEWDQIQQERQQREIEKNKPVFTSGDWGTIFNHTF
ncbi:T6SS effector BTH_I2691 family protein [Gilliamella apicola]|uniref:T6SS effector BTH_I2691 family protein n=1 Tax=Gilliamella apicola TaxID=1196095 RepID=UPI002FEE2678